MPQNSALKGLMQSAPVDQQINQLSNRNQILSGQQPVTAPVGGPRPMPTMTPQSSPFAFSDHSMPDMPGFIKALMASGMTHSRMGDVELPSEQWSMDELMRRSKALTGQ